VPVLFHCVALCCIMLREKLRAPAHTQDLDEDGFLSLAEWEHGLRLARPSAVLNDESPVRAPPHDGAVAVGKVLRAPGGSPARQSAPGPGSDPGSCPVSSSLLSKFQTCDPSLPRAATPPSCTNWTRLVLPPVLTGLPFPAPPPPSYERHAPGPVRARRGLRRCRRLPGTRALTRQRAQPRGGAPRLQGGGAAAQGPGGPLGAGAAPPPPPLSY